MTLGRKFPSNMKMSMAKNKDYSVQSIFNVTPAGKIICLWRFLICSGSCEWLLQYQNWENVNGYKHSQRLAYIMDIQEAEGRQ